MPRPRRQQPQGGSNQSQIHPGQAAYVLERLIGERRISPGEINRYVSEMQREINSLEQRLESLRQAALGGRSSSSSSAASSSGSSAAAPQRRRPGRPPGSGVKRRPGRPSKASQQAAAGDQGGASSASASAGGAKRGRRRRSAITAEQLASRQLQGRYLGLIRQIPASKRAQYQRLAKEKGREAAIKEMADTLGK